MQHEQIHTTIFYRELTVMMTKQSYDQALKLLKLFYAQLS